MPSKMLPDEVVAKIEKMGDEFVRQARRAARTYDLQTLAYSVNMAAGKREEYVPLELLSAVSALLLK